MDIPPIGSPEDPLQYSARLIELAELDMLGAARDDSFARLSRMTSKLVDAPHAAVMIVGGCSVYAQGATDDVPMDLRLPCDQTFCAHVARSGTSLVITDAREHERFRQIDVVQDGWIISYMGVPIVSATGHVLGSLCVFDDHPREWTNEQMLRLEDVAVSVCERIELRRAARDATMRADQLSEANAELSVISADRENFAAIASHELRTPLTVIGGSARTLLDFGDQLTEAQRTNLMEQINDQTGRMARMIDSLMRTVRLQTGRDMRQPEIVPVGAALSDLAQQLGVSAVVEADEQLEAVVDPDHLYQIIENLATNAQRYAGGLTEIVARSDDRLVRVEFRDCGPGVDKEFVPRLFDRFARGSDIDRGVGLGLSIVRQLAQASGGEVAYERREGGGSSFVLTLPRSTFVLDSGSVAA